MENNKELRHCDNCNKDLIEHEVTSNYGFDKGIKEWICKDCLRERLLNNIEILEQNKHISSETGLIVENYPYGFKRTKIRYWVESKKNKGDRFGSQTLNPNTNQWNNPKYSTYSTWILLIRYKDTGYINYIIGCENMIGYVEDIKRIDDLIKMTTINDIQKENIRVIKSYIKAYENVTYEIKSDGLHQVDKEKEDKEQEDIKKHIKNQVAFHYYKTYGDK